MYLTECPSNREVWLGGLVVDRLLETELHLVDSRNELQDCKDEMSQAIGVCGAGLFQEVSFGLCRLAYEAYKTLMGKNWLSETKTCAGAAACQEAGEGSRIVLVAKVSPLAEIQ